MKGRPVRAAGTALLAGILLLRGFRVWRGWESVWRFYSGGTGPFWVLLEAALFLGPFLAAGSAIAALWLRWERAGKLGAVNACTAAFFVFGEGLTVLAREMDGNAGYVGAEPLLSAVVCGISVLTVVCSHRAGAKRTL